MLLYKGNIDKHILTDETAADVQLHKDHLNFDEDCWVSKAFHYISWRGFK